MCVLYGSGSQTFCFATPLEKFGPETHQELEFKSTYNKSFILLLNYQKEICIINAMCGLAYLYKLRRILEEFVKLPTPFLSQGRFVVDTGIWF